jgi:hypothetical protein
LIHKKIQPLKDNSIGGSYTLLKIIWNGKEIQIPDKIKNQEDADHLKELIKRSVPEALWNKIHEMKRKYDSDYESSH